MKNAGLINKEYVNTVIKKRPRNMHKGDCGNILIVAGTKTMAGAAVFAAKASIKAGSGLVRVCTVRKIFPVIQISVPEAICIEWGKARKDLQHYDAIAIGPGMGVCRRTEQILKKILKEYDKTIIIDADGLNTISYNDKLQQMVRDSRADIIITPHAGEAKRLLGNAEIEGFTKEEIADSLVSRYGTITVVKGAGTLVAVSGGDAYTNTTGNPGMATAGSGDVLTGIITSFAGQGMTAENAAKAGVFVHGLAGDLSAEENCEYGVTASDIADHVPFAIKTLKD